MTFREGKEINEDLVWYGRKLGTESDGVFFVHQVDKTWSHCRLINSHVKAKAKSLVSYCARTGTRKREKSDRNTEAVNDPFGWIRKKKHGAHSVG